MGNQGIKSVVGEYLEVEKFPSDLGAKVLKHFQRSAKTNPDLEKLISDLRDGDEMDPLRNEETILAALPDKYKERVLRHLYYEWIKSTTTFKTLSKGINEAQMEAFAVALCNRVQCFSVAEGNAILDYLSDNDLPSYPTTLDKKVPQLVLVRYGKVFLKRREMTSKQRALFNSTQKSRSRNTSKVSKVSEDDDDDDAGEMMKKMDAPACTPPTPPPKMGSSSSSSSSSSSNKILSSLDVMKRAGELLKAPAKTGLGIHGYHTLHAILVQEMGQSTVKQADNDLRKMLRESELVVDSGRDVDEGKVVVKVKSKKLQSLVRGTSIEIGPIFRDRVIMNGKIVRLKHQEKKKQNNDDEIISRVNLCLRAFKQCHCGMLSVSQFDSVLSKFPIIRTNYMNLIDAEFTRAAMERSEAEALDQCRLDLALCDAVGRGDMIAVKRHLEDGARGSGSSYVTVSPKGSPLHIACRFTRPNILQYLLDEVVKKKNPDAIHERDLRQLTALHVACRIGWTEGVRVLLKYGARLDLRDELGLTPVHFAAASGKIDVLQYLRDYSKESNVSLGIELKTKAGLTPLQLCRTWECRRLLKIRSTSNKK